MKYTPRDWTIQQKLDRYILKSDTCWEWQGGCSVSGYGVVDVNGVSKRAHRTVWELANGPIPDGMLICHSCDNPKCVRLEHLFLGTSKDNSIDMVRKGRGTPKRTFTDEQIRIIRSEYIPFKFGYGKLAKKYGVSRSTIIQIVNHTSYADID